MESSVRIAFRFHLTTRCGAMHHTEWCFEIAPYRVNGREPLASERRLLTVSTPLIRSSTRRTVLITEEALREAPPLHKRSPCELPSAKLMRTPKDHVAGEFLSHKRRRTCFDVMRLQSEAKERAITPTPDLSKFTLEGVGKGFPSVEATDKHAAHVTRRSSVVVFFRLLYDGKMCATSAISTDGPLRFRLELRHHHPPLEKEFVAANPPDGKSLIPLDNFDLRGSCNTIFSMAGPLPARRVRFSIDRTSVMARPYTGRGQMFVLVATPESDTLDVKYPNMRWESDPFLCVSKKHILHNLGTPTPHCSGAVVGASGRASEDASDVGDDEYFS